MASYVTLGTRRATGAADTTGNNTGNWTVVFTPEVLGINVAYFEVYKMVISGAPFSTMNVYVDQKQWDTTIAGETNSWDPNEPLIMIPGQTLYFYWSDSATDNLPPSVTIWLRYDEDNQANQRTAHS